MKQITAHVNLTNVIRAKNIAFDKYSSIFTVKLFCIYVIGIHSQHE